MFPKIKWVSDQICSRSSRVVQLASGLHRGLLCLRPKTSCGMGAWPRGREATGAAPARLGAWSGGSGGPGSRVRMGDGRGWGKEIRGLRLGPSPRRRDRPTMPAQQSGCGGPRELGPTVGTRDTDRLSARPLKPRVGPAPGLLAPSRARRANRRPRFHARHNGRL